MAQTQTTTTTTEMTKAMTPAQQRYQLISGGLEKAKASIAEMLPKHMSADRVIRSALATVARNPTLLQCTAQSIVSSVALAAELGLEPSGTLGSAYLVPFKDGKDGKMKAQLIPGYRGLIDLAKRGGEVINIEARIVHEKDEFEIVYGTETRITHKPAVIDEPGNMICVYSIARLKDGSTQVEMMTAKQVLGIKARSKSRDNGPWKTDFEEMARKSCVKRLVKYLPLSIELARAMQTDDDIEAGRTVGAGVTTDVIIDTTLAGEDNGAAKATTKADEVKARLKAGKAAPIVDETEIDDIAANVKELNAIIDAHQISTEQLNEYMMHTIGEVKTPEDMTLEEIFDIVEYIEKQMATSQSTQK